MANRRASCRTIISAAALGLVSAAACDERVIPGKPTTGGAAATSVTLAVGETMPVPQTSLSITFARVLNDSRCPTDVVCIQAGDAGVALDATSGSTVSHLELRTSDRGRSALVGRYRLELTTLLPYPRTTHPIDPGEYRATVSVEAP